MIFGQTFDQGPEPAGPEHRWLHDRTGRGNPMVVCDFTFHRPRSLAEAFEFARELGDGACFFAGGTDLVPDFKQARDRADHLISLMHIPELATLRLVEDGTLSIGATATLNQIATSGAVREAYPALAVAAGAIAGVQVRNQATIGGNFCRAVPCADVPPVAIAGDATLTLVGADSERTVLAGQFFLGKRRTQLARGEILARIEIPSLPPHSGASYQRFTLRGGSALAVAAVAARVTLSGDSIETARVVMGAVAPVPKRAAECERLLTGVAPTETLYEKASRVAAGEAEPISDLRGSAAYRRRLVEVLTTRALREAVECARS